MNAVENSAVGFTAVQIREARALAANSQRRITDVLRSVNHWRIGRGAIRHDVHKDLGLPIGPLLKPGPVELHHDALAVAMSRSRVADSEPLFEDEEALAVVTDRVLFGRNDLTRRLHWWMIPFDVHFKERSSGRRFV